jgi:hypothetical protein
MNSRERLATAEEALTLVRRAQEIVSAFARGGATRAEAQAALDEARQALFHTQRLLDVPKDA